MNKLLLSKDTQEKLKIFLFITRPMNLQIPKERVLGILGYNIGEAISKAQETASKGFQIAFNGQAIEVEDLVENISIQKDTVKIPSEKREPEKLGKEAFKSGLLYTKNEIEKLDDQDKEDLERIINKI